MSESPDKSMQAPGARELLAGRWQIPLLLASLIGLAAGVWRLMPEPPPPSFASLYQNAQSLFDAELYTEASDYIRELMLDPSRTEAERHRLHRLMARIIHAHEQANVVHGRENAVLVLEHSDRSLPAGASHDPDMLLIRAEAFEWLDRPAQALEAYRQASALGVDDMWAVRRRIIEIQERIGATAEDLHSAYGTLVAGEGVPDELRFWAAERKVELFGRQAQHREAESFLNEYADLFRASTFEGQYEYLRAAVWQELGRLDEAERMLRSLRNGLEWSDPLYASSGWRLGRILQAQEAPEYAQSFYDEVIERTGPGPYRTASYLGRAEVLADRERYEESVASYEEAIRLATADPYGGMVDLRQIRESMTERYRELEQAGRLPEAMGYLRIASRLAPPADTERQGLYALWHGKLAFRLGERALSSDHSEDGEPARSAADCFEESGEAYLRLAELMQLDEGQSSEAVWQAANAFDRASRRERTAQVLEGFVRERTTSPRLPEALYRLGQTYQVMGRIEMAIARYQEEVARFSTTPWAMRSIVPLAQCFIDTGDFLRAEHELLRILSPGAGHSLRGLTPEALEYRDALFLLSDLYVRMGRYEDAIGRYEEVLERYRGDERADRATFMLADVYRLSAERIRDQDLVDPEKIAYRDHLRASYHERLRQAQRLYRALIDQYADRDRAELSQLEAAYLRLSHFYLADAMFDLSLVPGSVGRQALAEAAELYAQAAWEYRDDLIAMGAYVQMINCYLRLGEISEARRTLRKARYALDRIPDAAPEEHVQGDNREYWDSYLSWLEQTPTFTVAGTTGRG